MDIGKYDFKNIIIEFNFILYLQYCMIKQNKNIGSNQLLRWGNINKIYNK